MRHHCIVKKWMDHIQTKKNLAGGFVREQTLKTLLCVLAPDIDRFGGYVAEVGYQFSGQATAVVQSEKHVGVAYYLGCSPTICCDGWHACSHRLQKHHAERLVVGAEHKQVKGGEVPSRVGHLPDKAYRFQDAKLSGPLAQAGFKWPDTDYGQQTASWKIR